jgi:hypothetical protein
MHTSIITLNRSNKKIANRNLNKKKKKLVCLEEEALVQQETLESSSASRLSPFRLS